MNIAAWQIHLFNIIGHLIVVVIWFLHARQDPTLGLAFAVPLLVGLAVLFVLGMSLVIPFLVVRRLQPIGLLFLVVLIIISLAAVVNGAAVITVTALLVLTALKLVRERRDRTDNG